MSKRMSNTLKRNLSLLFVSPLLVFTLYHSIYTGDVTLLIMLLIASIGILLAAFFNDKEIEARTIIKVNEKWMNVFPTKLTKPRIFLK